MFFAIADLSGLNSSILKEQLDLCAELGFERVLVKTSKRRFFASKNSKNQAIEALATRYSNLVIYTEEATNWQKNTWMPEHKIKKQWIETGNRYQAPTVRAQREPKLEKLCSAASKEGVKRLVLDFSDTTPGNVSLCNKFGLEVVSFGAKTPIQIAQSINAGATLICSSNLEALAGALLIDGD